jgi:phosphoribosylformimino-5-aminoimidazole carboxamide ribotide isomerase
MSLEILPSIDLRNGQVVRLQQGDFARQLKYPVDPVQTAQSFATAGAKWMHIVDLDGAKEGKPVQTELIKKILQSAKLKVEVGGGVRSVDDIRRLLDAGASRVVVGTKAIEDWPWFESLMGEPKLHHKLVLALDAKEGVIATRGWTATSGKLAVDIAKQVSNWPLAAILYTDVAKDGMMEGPNIDQTSRLAAAGKVPVIASGGVGNIQHIKQLMRINVWGVVIGRSLYEGTLKLSEAIAVANGKR